MTKLTKRPWQGTVLGVVYILMIIGIILATISGLTAFLVAFILSQVARIGASFMVVFPIILVVAFISVIIFTLFVPAIFSGKKWPIVWTVFLAGWNFLTGIWNVFRFLIKSDLKNLFFALLGLIFISLIIWLALVCLKHPFYGGDGRIDVDSFKFWRKKRGDGEMITF